MTDDLYLGVFRECRPHDEARATMLFAHGAGAGMDSPFMVAMAEALAIQGIRTLRFEFTYMAKTRLDGRRRPPDPTSRLLEHWRLQIARWREVESGPLWLAGKSMGGRMASLIADERAAAGLVCFGYPFHPMGKPEKTRTEHLAELRTPTLIVQGARDALGNLDEVQGYRLADSIRLHWIPSADHDLKPLRRSGLDSASVLAQSAAAVAAFVETVCEKCR